MLPYMPYMDPMGYGLPTVLEGTETTDLFGALEARDAVDSLFKKEDWTMPTADMSLGQWVEAWEKNGKTGKLGQDRLEVRWEAVMFLFNLVI